MLKELNVSYKDISRQGRNIMAMRKCWISEKNLAIWIRTVQKETTGFRQNEECLWRQSTKSGLLPQDCVGKR